RQRSVGANNDIRTEAIDITAAAIAVVAVLNQSESFEQLDIAVERSARANRSVMVHSHHIIRTESAHYPGDLEMRVLAVERELGYDVRSRVRCGGRARRAAAA